jgi:hypothetical protein
MKNTTLPNKFFPVILISVCLYASSCVKSYPDGMDRDIYSLFDRAVGSQEEIPTSGPFARFEGSYNAGNNKLEYTINWTGLTGTATAVHFHGPATGGNPEGIHILSITSPGTEGRASGTISISEAEEAELLTFKWTYDIHTSSHANADITRPVFASPY